MPAWWRGNAVSGQFAGRVVIVTGSAGPTGRVIARRFAEEGARVTVTAHRGLERLDALVQDLTSLGAEVCVVEADLAKREGCQQLVDATLQRWGRVDVLVNNAGAMRGAPFPDLTEDDLEFALAVDLKAAFYCAQLVTPSMIERGGGRIVSISSIAASGSLHNANYAVAKAGLEGLTRTLALELGRHGITANCVSPGLILSEKTRDYPEAVRAALVRPSPMGVAVEPIDVANAVLFFASDGARYVTGQVLHVSGGLDVTVRGMQEGG